MVRHNRVKTCRFILCRNYAFINFIKGLVRRWVLISYCSVYEDQAKKPGLTHLQCLLSFLFFLVFLTSDFYHSYILPVSENAIQVNNFGTLS